MEKRSHILKTLDSCSLVELKTNMNPLSQVVVVCSAVGLIIMEPFEPNEMCWQTCVKIMKDPKFLEHLIKVDVKEVNPEKISMIKKSLVDHGISSKEDQKKLKAISHCISAFHLWLLDLIDEFDSLHKN